MTHRQTNGNAIRDKKNKPAVQRKPAPTTPQTTVTPVPDLFHVGSDHSVEGQASRLGDSRFTPGHRQQIANQIGQVTGNGYLQRIINSTLIQRECGVDESCGPEVDMAAVQDSSGTTNAPTGGVAADGTMSLGMSSTTQTTVGIDEDTAFADSSAVSGGASFNANTGQVGANASYTRTTEIGDETDTRGVSGSGYLDFNRHGELEGAGGQVGGSMNGTSVNIGGGIIVTAERPRRNTAGQWEVSWRRQYTLSGGGGHTGSSGRGGSVSLQGQQSITGKRTFPTQQEAQAFYAGRTWTDIDPAAAAQLGQGDQVTQGDTSQVSVGASGQVAGVTIGGSITIGGGSLCRGHRPGESTHQREGAGQLRSGWLAQPGRARCIDVRGRPGDHLRGPHCHLRLKQRQRAQRL